MESERPRSSPRSGHGSFKAEVDISDRGLVTQATVKESTGTCSENEICHVLGAKEDVSAKLGASRIDDKAGLLQSLSEEPQHPGTSDMHVFQDSVSSLNGRVENGLSHISSSQDEQFSQDVSANICAEGLVCGVKNGESNEFTEQSKEFMSATLTALAANNISEAYTKPERFSETLVEQYGNLVGNMDGSVDEVRISSIDINEKFVYNKSEDLTQDNMDVTDDEAKIQGNSLSADRSWNSGVDLENKSCNMLMRRAKEDSSKEHVHETSPKPTAFPEKNSDALVEKTVESSTRTETSPELHVGKASAVADDDASKIDEPPTVSDWEAVNDDFESAKDEKVSAADEPEFPQVEKPIDTDAEMQKFSTISDSEIFKTTEAESITNLLSSVINQNAETEKNQEDTSSNPGSLRKKKRRRSATKDSFGKLSVCSHLPGRYTFSAGDLVWGKVKSHPWWPGHIFDPSEASEQAMKYFTKDRLLVAFLGDGTFGWCEESQLAPFYFHFSENSKQTNAKGFRKAVSCALDEVARRVELGLMCACYPEDDRKEIESGIIINSGMREGAVVNNHSDITQAIYMFDPAAFLSGFRDLAKSPTVDGDLDAAFICAQASAFIAFKGLLLSGKVHADASVNELLALEMPACPNAHEPRKSPTSEGQKYGANMSQKSSSKGKRNPEANRPRKTKKRSIEELIGRSEMSQLDNEEIDETLIELAGDRAGSLKKIMDDQDKVAVGDESYVTGTVKHDDKAYWIRQRLESHLAEASSRKNLSHLKSKKMKDDLLLKSSDASVDVADVVNGSKENTERTPDSSIDGKVPARSPGLGDCIRRVARKLTSVTSPSQKLSSAQIVSESKSTGELFENLLIVAQEPLFWANKLGESRDLVNYFLEFRNSNFEKSSTRSGIPRLIGESKQSPSRVKIPSKTVVTDAVGSKKRFFPEKGVKRKAGSPLEGIQKRRKRTKVSVQAGDDSKKDLNDFTEDQCLKQYTRRSVLPFSPKHDSPRDIEADEKPAALFMRFPSGYVLPPESELKAKFARFGSIDASETKVFRSSGCAQVTFKKSSAAESAFSYVTDHCIFGSANVSFRLRYPSVKNNELLKDKNDSGREESCEDDHSGQVSSLKDRGAGADENAEDLSQPSSSLALHKPESSGDSQLLLIQHNLEMMTSMLSRPCPSTNDPSTSASPADNLLPAAKADIVDELMALLQKVTALVNQQSQLNVECK